MNREMTVVKEKIGSNVFLFSFSGRGSREEKLEDVG
jgi:hypothetical protein